MTIEKQTKDVALENKKQDSRRSLLKKAAIGAPVVMSLANKPAFGAVCSLSGFQSVNPSGVGRHGDGCGGISPGGWKQNGYKTNGDGNRNEWLATGTSPNPRVAGSHKYNTNFGHFPADGPGTLFFDIFPDANPTVSVLLNETLHDVLLRNPGSLEFHVISNYLNSIKFSWGNPGTGKVAAFDVVGIYEAFTNNEMSYTTISGNTLNLTGFDLHSFFSQLYH